MKKIYRIKRVVIFLSIAISSFAVAHAQRSINGSIKNSSGAPISGASLQLKHVKNDRIINFTITNEQGQFKLQCPYAVDSLLIEATHILYEKRAVLLKTGQDAYHIILREAGALNLPEVVMKQYPVQRTGDTVKYRVSSFSTAADRVIGDVIGKIPGLQVNENGQISYQGRPINRYYIEGLDLLGSQYNIANETIRTDLVDQVEVWERSQPIKVLDSISAKNEVVLNLKLNAKAKRRWNGQIMAGAGYPAPLGELELAAMKFVKDFQTLNAIKANNSGRNLTKELNELTVDINDWDKTIARLNTQPTLSIPKPEFNLLKEQRRLFNETVMPYVNILRLGKSGRQWRLNLQAYYDQRNNNFGNEQVLFLPVDTVKINEYQDWSDRQRGITASVQMEDNQSAFYRKHFLRVQYNTSRQNTLLNGSFSSQQDLDYSFLDIRHNFQWIKKARNKKNLIKVESATSSLYTESKLDVFPGVFEQVLNGNSPLNFIQQNIPVKTVNNNSQLSIQRLNKKWRLQWFLKSKFQWSEVSSTLFKDSSNILVKLPAPYANDFRVFTLSLQTGITFSRQFRKIEFQAEIPVGIQVMSRKETKSVAVNDKNIPLFLPTVLIQRRWRDYTLRMQSRIDVRPVNWQENFTDFIATDYRTLTAFSDQFLLQYSWSSGLSLYYNNAIKGLSGYGSVVYTRTIRNLLPVNQFNGIFAEQTYLDERNKQRMFFIMAGAGKYITSVKGGMQVNAQVNEFQTPGLQNGKRFDFINQMGNLKVKLFTRAIRALHVEANTELSLLRSKNNQAAFTQPSSIWLQQIQLTGIIVSDKLFLNASGEWGGTSQSNTKHNFQFINVGLNYKTKKIDWQLVVSNLFNTNTFILPSTSFNYQQQSTILLRPLNIILKSTCRL